MALKLVLSVVLASLLLMFSAKGTTGFTIRMKRSPSLSSSFNNLDSFKDLVLESASRAQFLSRKASESHSSNDEGKRLAPLPIQQSPASGYVVEFGIGTPPSKFYFAMDTASDVTWVQCDSCVVCMPVAKNNGTYFYENSTTFRFLEYGDPFCPIDDYSIVLDMCTYEASYARNAYSEGGLVSDTFVFEETGGKTGSVLIPEQIFGCGRNNSLGADGNILSGVFGMDRANISFMKQAASLTKLRFSYCLSKSKNGTEQYTDLNFGDDAKFAAGELSHVRSTSFLDVESGYFLKLNGISVNGIRLKLDPAMFRYDPETKLGGFIIDSGSVPGALVSPAFDKVRAVLVRYFRKKFGWKPLPPERVDGLCYAQKIKAGLVLPNMTYHFEGADLILRPYNLFAQIGNGKDFEDLFCLLILPGDISVLGSAQQKNVHFLYDLAANKLSFIKKACPVSKFH